VADAYGVAFGDLDNDGDLDLYFATMAANQVWLNDGTGEFSDSTQRLGSSNSRDVSLADLDNDGDLDAFVANYGEGNRVWLNDGTGVFTDSMQQLGSSDSSAVRLTDLDNDGDVDAVEANRLHWNGFYYINGWNRVWFNDGTGVFTRDSQIIGNSNSDAIAVGDLDNDGDPDLISDDGSTLRIWSNNGTGQFFDSGQTLGTNSYAIMSIEVGDMNDDGNLDIIVGRNGNNEVLLNDGTGSFSASGQLFPGTYDYPVSLGDLNGDGHLDAFFATDLHEGYSQIWLNDGTGQLYGTGQSLADNGSNAVVLGDVDGDGDLDAFTISRYSELQGQLWLNQEPLKITKTAPPIATVGQPITYTIQVTNIKSVTATNIVISDTIPAGAAYITGGLRSGNVVSWTVPSLAGGESVSVNFVVTATATITNYDYGVTSVEDVTVFGWPHVERVTVMGQEAVTTVVNSSVEAGFIATPLTGIAPLTVTFVNSSTGATDYLWNFGDGSTGTVINPTHVYTQAGVYTISLTVSGPGGNQTLTKPHYISVGPFQIIQVQFVDNDKSISAVFSHPVNPASISVNTFQVRGKQTGLHTGTYTVNGQTVQFTPSVDFLAGEKIAIILTDDILVTDGVTLTPYVTQLKVKTESGSGIFVDGGQQFSMYGGNAGSGETVDTALADLDGDGDLDAFLMRTDLGGGAINDIWWNDGNGQFSYSGQEIPANPSQKFDLCS
jgi:uncharacterized repeat protein (TIGR01451 family)